MSTSSFRNSHVGRAMRKYGFATAGDYRADKLDADARADFKASRRRAMAQRKAELPKDIELGQQEGEAFTATTDQQEISSKLVEVKQLAEAIASHLGEATRLSLELRKFALPGFGAQLEDGKVRQVGVTSVATITEEQK